MNPRFKPLQTDSPIGLDCFRERPVKAARYVVTTMGREMPEANTPGATLPGTQANRIAHDVENFFFLPGGTTKEETDLPKSAPA